MVLVYSYAGNLTAMLARPKLQSPIRTLEELLAQNEVPWVIERGGLPEYFMSTAATGSVMTIRHSRPAMKQAFLVAYLCKSLKYAGTVTTQFVTSNPSYLEALYLILARI